jgi:hypothetical protein
MALPVRLNNCYGSDDYDPVAHNLYASAEGNDRVMLRSRSIQFRCSWFADEVSLHVSCQCHAGRGLENWLLAVTVSFFSVFSTFKYVAWVGVLLKIENGGCGYSAVK